MLRASPAWLSLSFIIAACSNPETGNLDTTQTASETGTTGTTGESGDTDTGDTETGTDTDDPEVDEPLRFIAAGSQESLLLAINLDNPADVPPAEFLTSGDGIAGLFGPTPFGSHVVTHHGKIEQVQLSPAGELSLAPLASQPGDWLSSVWFGDQGANALVSPSVDPLTGADRLLWVRYDQAGEITGSFDITPPKQPGGSVLILARSPDARWAAAAIDVQGTGIWDLYLLPTDPDPGATFYVDKIDLTGIPAISVGSFLSLHLDDQRLVYRREQLIDLYRPVAVGLDNPDANPADIGPNLEHTYSIAAAPHDASRLLVTNEGVAGYRELRLIELDGPTSILAQTLITEPNTLALENSQPALGVPTRGHGIDALGRVWYAYEDTTIPGVATVGINLATVVDGAVAQRLALADIPAGATIANVIFDTARQLLGYRVQSGNSSWICHVDLTADQPAPICIDQNFEHDADEPGNHASFGWSADRTRIAVIGVQQGQTVVHVAELGDAGGSTVEIGLPNVEDTPGFAIDHRPAISPNGEQLLVWYGTRAGHKGLIHAPTDGTATGQVVLAPQHALSGGAYIPHAPD